MKTIEYQELSKARKRLLAVLFSFLKDKQPTLDYVKIVACKAAKIDHFNSIPLNQLKSLYRIFGTKNTKNRTETERELIWTALRETSKN
jgi:hypothetical protein